jgi:hypothetical protein
VLHVLVNGSEFPFLLPQFYSIVHSLPYHLNHLTNRICVNQFLFLGLNNRNQSCLLRLGNRDRVCLYIFNLIVPILSIVFNLFIYFIKVYLNFIYLKQITKSSSRYLTNNFDNFAFLIQPMSTEENHFIL